MLGGRRKPLLCLKLSNSGDTLELLIPNYIRKFISGWANHSCKVISQKTSEKKVGNRGSKSVICKSIAVKVQRVNGSCKGAMYSLLLRCTLTGFEINYPVGILSNRSYINSLMQMFSTSIIKKVIFSTSIIPSSYNVGEGFNIEGKLHPDFTTGFTDLSPSIAVLGEGRGRIFWYFYLKK